MKQKFRATSIVLVIFFFSSSATSAKPYFEQNPIPPTLLTPPFSIGSIGWQHDVDEIVEMQKNPDPREIEQAWMENELSPESLVQTVDPKLLRGQFSKFYRLLDRTIETTEMAVRDAKNHWNKKRPYLASTKVQALVNNSYSKKSYPSGHSAESYIMAHILGILIPEQREKFYERAEKIARHRMLVGMHYSNDLEGSRQLALILIGSLLASEEFQKDFAEVKQELSLGR